MSKATTAISAEKLASYERLVVTVPGVERKGAAMPYTSRNGHMFSFLTPKGALALRLPEGERQAFLKKFGAKPCVQHGVVMREYVEVPDALLARTRDLRKWFEWSYAYVGSLKPKPTKRAGKRG